MEIKYNVQAPPKKSFNGGTKSEEIKNMCFQYNTPKEAKSKLSTISSHRRKYNAAHPKGYDAYRVDACIYIMRVEKGK